MSRSDQRGGHAVLTDHRRQWRDCVYVYPVISRRARGLSIGVNLNTDKRCNFHCVYCQIDRTRPRAHLDVDLARLRTELDAALQAASSGELWREERFADTPKEFRRINDIAFSGDGEPTCLRNFDEVVRVAADALADRDLRESVKLVVITNATKLRSPQVQRALPILDEGLGEIWAKLDAGTEGYFRRINNPGHDVHLEEICDNILAVGTARPVTIQTLMLSLDGRPPSQDELNAYCLRLRWLMKNGATIDRVQLHTIARSPAEASAQALRDEQLDTIAAYLRTHLPDLPVDVFYGQSVPPQGQ